VTGNLDAAERAARAFMELDGTNEARALLGLVLHEQHEYTTETLALLERSGDDYPTARVLAARVLIELGQIRKAKAHLQAYMSEGNMERRREASELLDYIDQREQATNRTENR
jgi:hypothetical protein